MSQDLIAFEAWSANGRLGVRLRASVMTAIRSFCVSADPNETGGILIGRYVENHRLAEIVQAVGPTPDSRAGRTWFWRGTKGLQELLDRLWINEGLYYLGEWHYHVRSSPAPSPTDDEQMYEISRDPSWSCPEPILLIMSWNGSSAWSTAVFIYRRDRPCVRCSIQVASTT